MCLGVPMQVLESTRWAARCAGPEGEASIDMALVGEQPVGTWVLTFLGAAREVIDPARASAINNALAALQAALHGDATGIDALFADLLEREPSLPAHLTESR